MGRQLEARVTFAGVERPRASVHLDSRALQISGRPRIEVTFAEVQHVAVAGGRLSLSTARGLLLIEAGAEAEAWAEKIRTPPTRAKKLGLRPGLSIALRGLDDPSLAAEAEAAGANVVALKPGVDLVFWGVSAPAELGGLPALIEQLAPAGALWVVRTKGRGASVSEAAVRSAARSAGLVDVKVVAFSETQSADKFVIPVAERRDRGSPVKKKRKPKAAGVAAPARRASAPPARAPADRARKG